MIPLGIVRISERGVSPIPCVEKGGTIPCSGSGTTTARIGGPSGFITGGTYHNIVMFNSSNKERNIFQKSLIHFNDQYQYGAQKLDQSVITPHLPSLLVVVEHKQYAEEPSLD
jgi:hypothetical protein